ncbi:MAG: hypothetical protein RLZZ584_3071, partial [Pseudomonadota bacterium]
MTPTRLSIVDTALGDLVVSLQDAGVHGVLLSGGPAEVGRHLAACGAVDVLELFCHGQAGALHLGAQRWDAEAVLRQAAAFRPWTGHLKPGAAIHLHACRAGAGEAGAALIYALASVTGATVCAASHDLGRSDDGSEHWQLDRQAGQPGPHQPRSLAGVAGRLVILSG